MATEEGAVVGKGGEGRSGGAAADAVVGCGPGGREERPVCVLVGAGRGRTGMRGGVLGVAEEGVGECGGHFGGRQMVVKVDVGLSVHAPFLG